MTKGFVTVATGSKKYYDLAKNLVKSYRLFTKKNMPFAIITDSNNKDIEVFDDVIILDNPSCSWMDKIEILKYCPYDENIFIDADCLAYGDINEFWQAFQNSDDFSCFGLKLSPEEDGGWFKKSGVMLYQEYIEYSVHLHGIAYFIRKGTVCEELYLLCQDIIKNYDRLTFSGFNDKLADEPIFALAMAIKGLSPVSRKPYYYTFVPYATQLTVDICEGAVDFVNPTDGEVNRALLVHWGNYNTERAVYKTEVEKLNMILDGKKDFLTDPLKNKILNNNIKQDSKADRRKKYLYYKKRLIQKIKHNEE